MNSRLRFKLIRGYGIGRGAHTVRAKVRARIGATVNRNFDEVCG